MKLTDPQASQALEPVQWQIGQTTDFGQLGALAEGLQALAGKLTEAQASQALDPLLRQIGQTTDFGQLGALAEGSQALGGEADGGAGEPGA